MIVLTHKNKYNIYKEVIIMVLYHGSDVIVRNPEVRKTRYAKDFSWGFYCTSNYEQAARWSKKAGLVVLSTCLNIQNLLC